MASYQAWRMIPLYEEAIIGGDCWTGLANSVERRKRQNRLNQRAARRRCLYGNTSAPSPSSSETFSSTEIVPDEPLQTEYQDEDRVLVPNDQLIQSNREETVAVSTPPKISNQNFIQQKTSCTRVKTGCLTCRKRRVKCDEAKPTCKRCVSGGHYCAGYVVTINPTFPVFMQPGSVTYPVEARPNQAELELFHLLSTQVMEEIAWPRRSRFWTIEVLQATQRYPAIWHATLAMAAVHVRAGIKEQSQLAKHFQDRYDLMAVTHYNQSIKYILTIKKSTRSNPSRTDQETALAASILFTMMCCIRGKKQEAMTHARHGLQLLSQWESWHISWGKKSQQGLVFMVESVFGEFTRLSGQLRPMLTSRPGETRIGSPSIGNLNATFSSLQEAYASFALMVANPLQVNSADEGLLNSFQRTPHPSSRLSFRNEFHEWKKKFQHLKNTKRVHHDDAAVASGLSAWEYLGEVVLDLEPPDSELYWDKHLESFVSILDILEPTLEKQTKETMKRGRAHVSIIFSTCSPFSGPLTYVAMNCRNSSVRRRALGLLAKCPRQNGLWETASLTAIIDAKMHFEEGNLDLGEFQDMDRWEQCDCIRGVFICNDHRVAEYTLDLVSEGVGRLILRTSKDVLKGQRGYEMNIFW